MIEITVETLKRCSVITLSGEADHAAAPELERGLLDLIKTGHRNLVLNLQALTYISSAGLRALMSAQREAQQQTPPGKIVFSELPAVVETTFRLVGFHQLFDLYASDAQAVGSF
jgi:anti-sigma B factor antagonist